jgi:hypothetical protein
VFTFLIKFSIAFSLSYLLLTVPFAGKQLFWHLYDITGPIGGKVKTSLSKNIEKSYEKTKNLGQQFFKNSNPRMIVAPLNEKHKKILKERNRYKKDMYIREDIRHDDSQALNNIIKKSK